MSSISDVVDEILNEVDADRQEVRQDYENLIVYSVPPHEAKQSVIRKHRGEDGD